MILRTLPTVNSQPPAAPRLRVFAAGSIAPNEHMLQAPSLNTVYEIVEHRVTRVGDKWVAEVRVDEALQARAIFRGRQAKTDAQAWCDLLAPHAPAIDSNTLDDDEWAAIVNAQFESAPVDEAEDLTPEHVGARDYERGWPCDPTRYYTKLGDIEGYIIGWKGAEETARAALDALDEDRFGCIEDEVDWIRWGC